jgi:DNA-directed RNA polymerase subunit M/transcription elongation factor TFIIS
MRTATVESVHNTIHVKINDGVALVDKVKTHLSNKIKTKNYVFGPLDSISEDLKQIRTEYDIEVMDIVCSYYEGDAGAADDYFSFIATANPTDKIGELINQIYIVSTPILTQYNKRRGDVKDTEIEELYNLTHSVSTATLYKSESIKCTPDICDECGAKMFPISDISKWQCFSCGYEDDIEGMIFNSRQFYTHDHVRNRQKTPNQSETRHFKSWIERIQGIENKEIPACDRDKFLACFERDGVRPKTDLTYKKLRAYARELKMSTYNEHMTLLLRIFSGKSPPLLSHDEYKRVKHKFDHIMQLYHTVVGATIKPYYPYFIYKAIEAVFKGDKNKLKLLDYIHVQYKNTLQKNDNIFEQICRLGETEGLGIEYKATPRVERL